MKFTDAATLSGTRRTSEGYLIADAFAVRTGIQLYTGAEMGRPDMDVVRVYRPEAEVRASDSLRTFSHAPVTMLHPKEAVTADNWKDLAVGEVSTEAVWQDGKIKLPLILKDAATIAAVEGGTRELSAGYTCRVDFTDGLTDDGQPYDAVQRDIRANHLAIVPRGRAGPEFRIGDAVSWGVSPVHDAEKEVNMTLRKIMVDGLSVETTDAGAQAIEKLQGIIATKDKAIADAETAKKKAEDDKDEEIGKLKADLKKAQDAAPTPEQMRAAVKDRAALEATAKAISDSIDLDLADADLRKAAVAAKLGDEMVKDASDAEVAGMFKAIAKDAKPVDPVRGVIADGLRVVANDGWDVAAKSAGIELKKGA